MKKMNIAILQLLLLLQFFLYLSATGASEIVPIGVKKFIIDYTYISRCFKVKGNFNKYYYNDARTKGFYDWQVKNREKYLQQTMSSKKGRNHHKQECGGTNRPTAGSIFSNIKILSSVNGKEYGIYRRTHAGLSHSGKQVVKTNKGYRLRVLDRNQAATKYFSETKSFAVRGLGINISLPEEWRHPNDFVVRRGVRSYISKRIAIKDSLGRRIIPNFALIVEHVPANTSLVQYSATKRVGLPAMKIKKSFGGGTKMLPPKNAYGYILNYKDDRGIGHTVYMVHILKNGHGGQIILDCTTDVFPKLESEFNAILVSLR